MPKWAITLIAFIVGAAAWAGLAYTVTNYVPDSTTISLGMVLAFIAITGTVLPPIHYLNYRFAGEIDEETVTRPDDWRIYRQSGMLGLLAAICLWFQLMRVLNWIIVLLLVGVFVLIEVFFRSRNEP